MVDYYSLNESFCSSYIAKTMEKCERSCIEATLPSCEMFDKKSLKDTFSEKSRSPLLNSLLSSDGLFS